MTFFLLSWVSWSCLGDFTLLGRDVRPLPVDARAAAALVAPPPRRIPLCRTIPEVAFAPTRAEVLRRLKDLGPGAEPRVRWCQRLRCWEKKVAWNPVLSLE